jgi:helicase MOV-10
MDKSDPRYQACPQQLSQGVCIPTDCPFNHSYRICEPCGVVCLSSRTFDAHLKGKPHRKQINGANNPPGGNVIHCSLCDRYIPRLPAHFWDEHIRGKYHNRVQRFIPLQQAIEESEKDKHGITVDGVFDLGVIDVSEMNRAKSTRVTLRNNVPNSQVVILQCRITSKINARWDTGYECFR